jgi:hypothetical protein
VTVDTNETQNTSVSTLMEPMDVVKTFVICPHCGGGVVVEELNCAIFRHAAFRSNGEQIPPHSTQQSIETWRMNNLIMGCGGPFKVVKNIDNEWVAEICTYC